MKAASAETKLTAQEACCRPERSESPTPKSPCPQCGEAGRAVQTITLKHHVTPEHLNTVERGPFYFCRTATCDVVYFNTSGVVLHKPDVRQRIGLKETKDPVPLCYCFGFTEAMVREEIRTTGRCTIPQRIAAEVKAGNCACEICNPQGSCCLGNVAAAVRKALTNRPVAPQETPSTQGVLNGVENRRR
jgi:hypothetical protein